MAKRKSPTAVEAGSTAETPDFDTGGSTLDSFGMCPSCSFFAVKVARNWQEVPTGMPDEEAIKRGFINIATIELILSIFSELSDNCLSNRKAEAFRRVDTFGKSNDRNGLFDRIRLQRTVGKKMNELGYNRDRGDVKELADQIRYECAEITEDEFANVHTELLFMAI